ncbi:sigma 54-interacting transcriptional regulator [uncultured Algibacter sp.]|uniref:sigma 54-interacting transcriptional regulator n=1 Tax=uncultured Algibacter sp. TaxID=298659 RepID=UPI00261D17ED|nr:sigma 54-interacting transcriptional regulator [uncultured Algibacter sp.]
MSKKTILIVDDTFENLYLLRVILEEAGYIVIEAKNGSDGLKELYKNNKVELIISDILMPIMDGYLFCQACKKEKLFADIPFVFYTSTYTEELDEDFALKLGATKFLRKPIEHDKLLYTVNNIFGNLEKNKTQIENSKISQDEVLKLYSERLINKLEQKSLDLGNEVAERKKAEQLLIQKNEILDLIAVNTPLKKIFKKLLLNYEAVHPNYFGSISILEEDGIHLNLVSAPSMPKPYNLALKRFAIGKNVGSCGTAAFTKKPVIVSDISNHDSWKDYKALASDFNLKSCWSIPILSKNNTVLGTFAIYSKSVSKPTLEEIRELNFAVSLANITIERFRAIEEIKKEKEFSSGLLKSMHEGLYAINLESEIISVNPSFCKMTGFTEKELLGLKRPYPFSPPELKEKNDERFKLLTQNKNKSNYENTYMHKSGKRFPVQVIVSSILDEKGAKIANFATIQDITERKAAEIELKLEKEFSETLITSLNEGLSVVDTNGIHIKVNSALCEMTGFTEKELVGIKAPFPYWPPEEYDSIYKAFNDPLNSLDKNRRAILMRKNGERFPVMLSSSIIRNNKGKVLAYFTIITDITYRVQTESFLKKSVKISEQRKNIIIELANLIGEDFYSSLKKIATTSANALNVALVTIWEFKNDNTELLSRIHFNKLNNEFETEKVLVKKDEFPEYFDALKNETSLNISDVLVNPITKAFSEKKYTAAKILARIDVLVYGRNGNYGVISFECITPNRVFTSEEESFATSIASIVALMVESKERTLAEVNMKETNELLVKANTELTELRNQLERENVYLRNELDLVFNYEEMVYGSEEFSDVLTEVEKVAPTNATVLLLGESGTGKELLARAIHNNSLRNSKPLIKVNCSAIPRELIESELFGHKKGSFTGAFSDKVGKFELADGGTLFLDEIGELPLDMQPKILRFLQEGEIEVVGGTGLKKLNVRVIAATNRNLIEEIEKKQFREDLYFRLNVFPIIVPSLRKRRDDIPLLVEHFVDKFNKAYDKNIKYISDDSMMQLKSYDWPGNIRELENLIERSAILSNDETLLIPGFESEIQKSKLAINDKNLTLATIQRNHIYQVLEKCNWKISGPNGASTMLDLKPSTLRDKMKKLGISKP